MKIKSLLLLTVLVLSLGLTCCVGADDYVIIESAPDNSVSSGVAAQAEEDVVTMRQMADFLMDKKEHYPLSDEFIERYQQTGGGYLDTARKVGLTVDKLKHEPNQKWHFFESWLNASIEDGSLTWDADARQRVYINLQCPELLLWIYEASGVDPAKVKQAKDVAEQGKVEGKKTISIAKDMRTFVPWEDIANAVKGYVPTPSVKITPSKLTLTVGEQATVAATLLNAGDVTESAVWNVTEGDGLVEITPNGNEATVRAIVKGTAKIKVSYGDNLSAECVVTVKEQSVTDPIIEGTVKYNLSGTSTAQKKTVEDALAAFSLAGEGGGIVNAITQIAFVYGGGSGGSGENRWSSTDMIKIGTGSNNGSITIDLNVRVSGVRITGYVHDSKCAIRVGDSDSTDWTDAQGDNKTATVICSDMTVVNKTAVDEGNVSVIEIDFESTSSLTIATVNTTSKKYPLYITSIEFFVETK